MVRARTGGSLAISKMKFVRVSGASRMTATENSEERKPTGNTYSLILRDS